MLVASISDCSVQAGYLVFHTYELAANVERCSTFTTNWLRSDAASPSGQCRCAHWPGSSLSSFPKDRHIAGQTTGVGIPPQHLLIDVLDIRLGFRRLGENKLHGSMLDPLINALV